MDTIHFKNHEIFALGNEKKCSSKAEFYEEKSQLNLMMDFVMDPSSRASVRKGSQKGIIGVRPAVVFWIFYKFSPHTDIWFYFLTLWAKSGIFGRKLHFEKNMKNRKEYLK